MPCAGMRHICFSVKLCHVSTVVKGCNSDNFMPWQGRGTVVTGRVEQGIVRTGDEVEIVGINTPIKTTVTGVEMFKKQLNEGQAGDNVGLLLRGIKRDDVVRGQVCDPFPI